MLSAGTLSGQNKKPITLPDTVRINVDDTGSLNVLSNDRDPNSDPIKLTWFYGISVPASGIKTIAIKDTGTFTVSKNGVVKIYCRSAGTFTIAYVCNDGKAGAGKTGYLTLIGVPKLDSTFYLQPDVYLPIITVDRPTPCQDRPDGKYMATVGVANRFYRGELMQDTSNGYYLTGENWWLGYPLDTYSQRKNHFTLMLNREIYLFILRNGCRQ